MVALNFDSLATSVSQIAYNAGQIILKYYHNRIHTTANMTLKDDGSPVTSADFAANQAIIEQLLALTPSIPIVAEESPPPHIEQGKSFWLVDPLDGTKQYIDRTGEFTVNIALVENHRPVLGVIYVPTQDRIYVGYKGSARTGRGAEADERIYGRDFPPTGLDVVYSRSDENQRLVSFPVPITSPIRDYHYLSSSLKFCLIAQGRFDVHVRGKRTFEWDTAAGQAIVEAAGGLVLGPDGLPLQYQKPQWLNSSFMVLGRPSSLT